MTIHLRHLWFSSKIRDFRWICQLLEQNVEVNERNERGMTPLCFAVHEGRSEAREGFSLSAAEHPEGSMTPSASSQKLR